MGDGPTPLTRPRPVFRGLDAALRHDMGVVEAVARERRLWRNSLWVVPPLSALVACLSLSRADTGEIGDLGLITAIPAPVFASLALLGVGFVLSLLEDRLRAPLLAAHLVVFVVILHGAAALVEPEPRFATAWLHAGFIEYIGRTGDTLPSLDARFNWPGFFSAAALLTGGVGLHDPMAVVKWAAVGFNLFALVPVYLIAAMTTRDSRAPWLAAWLFVPANWVGQDYFSPQAMGFALFLTMVVVLLRYFSGVPPDVRPGAAGGDRSRLTRRLWEVARAEGDPAAGRAVDASTARCLFAVLLLLYCAIVWSHQLTPYFAVAGIAGLVLVGACRLRTLPILLAVILIAFISYLAVTYWAGHLHEIFGGLGRVGSTVSSNVGNRVSGNPAHEWVARIRILMTVAVLGLAFVGAARRWRAWSTSVSLLVLAAAPFSVVFLQAYGGEALLRSYLFSLPFAAALMAASVVFSPGARLRAATFVLLATTVLVAGFFVARFGNEAFEMVRPGEAAAIERLHRMAPLGSTLVSADENVPWRYSGIERFTYESVPPASQSPQLDLDFVLDELNKNPLGGYFLITTGQVEYARITLGVGHDWERQIYRRLAATRRFKLIFTSRDARVYRLRPGGKGPVTLPTARPLGPQ
jgi:hypothetical protein